MNETIAPYTCPKCRRRSWHPRDIEERFCSVCGFEDGSLTKRVARDVFVFLTGQIAVFDNDGEQILELQGTDSAALRDAIRARSDDETAWIFQAQTFRAGEPLNPQDRD